MVDIIKNKKRSLGYLEGWLSAILNISLFCLKLWVGMISGSVAMIADAWHTLSDTLTSGIVILGFWISAKPRDRKHPFGHGRAELIGTLIISILLGFIGLKFLKESFIELKHYLHIEYKSISLFVFTISIIVKEGLAQFSVWAGKRIKSKALIADGWHHRSDAFASLIIVIGAFFGKQFWWIDGVLGIIVSLFILYTAFDILKDTADSLLGREMDEEVVNKIKHAIYEVAPEASEAHHFHIHRYGDHEEITMHLKMPGEYSLDYTHNLVTKVENKLREKFNVEPTIHCEPISHVNKLL